MTARITEHDEAEGHVVRIEGSLCGEDARLVERLCTEAAARGNARVLVDLEGLMFLDEPSADVLKRLRAEHGVTFRGCCLFNERLIDNAK
jgi:anti-anti-sigma regulatory factor